MKTSVLIGSILILAFSANAQSYYKIGEHTITVSADNTTHTYKYMNNDIKVRMHNTANKYTNVIMQYADGSDKAINIFTLNFTPEGGDEDTYNEMVALCDSIITKFDGERVRKNINHHEPLFVEFAVNSSTGKIEDISYRIPIGDGFDEVSPTTYYYIEKALKENVSFVITDTERQFNYLPIEYHIYLPEKK